MNTPMVNIYSPWNRILGEIKDADKKYLSDSIYREDLEELVLFLMGQFASEKLSQLFSQAQQIRTVTKASKATSSSEQLEAEACNQGAKFENALSENTLDDTDVASASELSTYLSGSVLLAPPAVIPTAVKTPTQRAFDDDNVECLNAVKTISIASPAKPEIEKKTETPTGEEPQTAKKGRRKSANDMMEESKKESKSSMPTLEQIRVWQLPNAPPGFSPQDAFELLHKVFPPETLEQLQWDVGGEISESHDGVSVFFSDIVGFTEWCSKVSSSTVIGCLSAYFQILDDLAERCGVYKVETIGDAWMAVCGAPKENENHAKVMAHFALEVVKTLDDLKEIFDHPEISLRIGLHCGPVVSGVVRADRPRWQLFGDTVNMASRMESTGVPGRVQISQDMHQALINAGAAFHAVSRGLVQVKGKGEQETFFLEDISLGGNSPKCRRLSVFNPRQMRPRSRSLSTYACQSAVEQMSDETLQDEDKASSPSPAMISAGTPISKPRRSSVFAITMTVPLEEADDEIGEVDSMQPQESRNVDIQARNSENFGSTKAVLLVDDMLSVLMQYRRVLQKTGLQIFTARDGLEGLFLMQQQMFVVVFMDLTMPKMSGSECVFKFRKWENENRIQKQHIVALTGTENLSEEEKSQLFAKGFDAIDSKTNSKAAILSSVTKLIKKDEKDCD